MNKSRVARDLWRKVFNDNLIDLKDSDARKQVVREFLIGVMILIFSFIQVVQLFLTT